MNVILLDRGLKVTATCQVENVQRAVKKRSTQIKLVTGLHDNCSCNRENQENVVRRPRFAHPVIRDSENCCLHR